ncbi:MFS transporter [Amycolatopsis sp. PS_44_ISF1]|uniref:MFS transporter n=1 Tax=Amycolatopsis sp. PS_44_ISF1 TaxID=2974917 RepID=UPI0028DDC18E|nr:MFS transporter [Amycolatopsis sp. PS_44_ISF1]MDT8913097.1 MFS transporter [Amycolatopsis sp. PS_44_ISF1]
MPLPVALALGLVVLTQAAQEVYGPAHAKLLRRIVPREQLAAAVSVNQARGYGASLIAPSAGGLLLALNPALPFAVDALTFGASALCLVLLATGRRAGPPPEEQDKKAAEPLLRQVGAGWRHLVREPFLRMSSLYFAVLNLLFSTFTYALILGIARGRYLGHKALTDAGVLHGDHATVRRGIARLTGELGADEVILVPYESDGAARVRTVRHAGVAALVGS